VLVRHKGHKGGHEGHDGGGALPAAKRLQPDEVETPAAPPARSRGVLRDVIFLVFFVTNQPTAGPASLSGDSACFNAARLRQTRQAVKGTRCDAAAVPATVSGETVDHSGASAPASLGNREGAILHHCLAKCAGSEPSVRTAFGWRPASQETWPPTSLVRCPGPDRGVGPTLPQLRKLFRRSDPTPAPRPLRGRVGRFHPPPRSARAGPTEFRA